MPARPGQHDRETQARWERRRLLFGARLRELRVARSLTQESVALESGISRNQIIAVEWGRSSLAVERVFDLADALGVPVNELLMEPTQMPSHHQHRGGRQRRAAGN